MHPAGLTRRGLSCVMIWGRGRGGIGNKGRRMSSSSSLEILPSSERLIALVGVWVLSVVILKELDMTGWTPSFGSQRSSFLDSGGLWKNPHLRYLTRNKLHRSPLVLPIRPGCARLG